MNVSTDEWCQFCNAAPATGEIAGIISNDDPVFLPGPFRFPICDKCAVVFPLDKLQGA